MSGSNLCIPRNETVISKTGLCLCSVSHFLHSYICERFIYLQDILSAYSTAGKYVDQSWDYINLSLTPECGNWDWGRAIPRKGWHKWDFPCSACYESLLLLFNMLHVQHIFSVFFNRLLDFFFNEAKRRCNRRKEDWKEAGSLTAEKVIRWKSKIYGFYCNTVCIYAQSLTLSF